MKHNPQPLGVTVNSRDANMKRPNSGCAFEPVIINKPGIDAIYEGLRQANVGFKRNIEGHGGQIEGYGG